MSSTDGRIFWVFLPSRNLKTLILLSILVYFKVLGLEINIGQDSHKIHCVPSNEPLQLLNPFPALLGSDNAAVINDPYFISMEWAVSKPGKSEVVIITIIKTNPEVISSKYAAYKFWNLQINNVEADDTAKYTARLTFTNKKETKDFNLTIAKTPVLKSDKITVTKQLNDQKVTHKCGEIADLGTPPINLYWKSVRDGSVLPGDFKDGFLTITLPESEEVTCEFNESTAAACIPRPEMGRWKGTSVGTLSASSGDTKYIIIGCIAGGIILVVILIIVLVVLIIKKRKGKNYNAKKEEAKVEEQSETNIPLVDRSFDENDSHRKPIYRGPPESPSPRTGSRTKANNNSRVQEALDNGDYEEYSANGKAPAVPPKYRKKGEVKEDGDGDEKRPPKVKPRSIFLTPSMEELDKINTAVAGGKGSEPRDTARRGSEPLDNEPRDTARRGYEPRDAARRGGADPRDTARRGSEPLDNEPRDTARRGTEPRDTGRKGTESRDTGRRGTEPRDTGRRGTEPRDTGRSGTEPRGGESKGPAPRGTLV